MSLILNFIERLYNSVRYRGFYIILALLFPFIIYKLDAGSEIIESMTEKGFGLNIGLSILTFSMLSLSVWSIPTVAIRVFLLIFNLRRGRKKDEYSVEKANLKNCLFNQLINVYNGYAISTGESDPGDLASRPQLPVRYFAIAPWALFIITCLKVFTDGTNAYMYIGIVVIVVTIGMIDWNKARIVSLFEWLLNKDKNNYRKKVFLNRYALLMVGYYVFIFLLIIFLWDNGNVNLLKYLLCILNFLFLLICYTYLLFMENSNLQRYLDKNNQPAANLSFRISNLNYSILLTYLVVAIITFYYLDQYELIQYISTALVIVTMCASLIVFFELLFTSQLLLVRIVNQRACVNKEDVKNKETALKAYRFVLIGLIIVIINLYFLSSVNSHRMRIVATKTKEEYVPESRRQTLTDYFQKWYNGRHADKGDSVVYLLSGQGGGSRAAAWFFMNMADLNKRYPGFFDKVFSISTVSGSSTGANMFLASQYFNKEVDTGSIQSITEGLYGRNYMSSAFYGLLLGDFLESFADRGQPFPRDRNYHLQREELAAFNETFNLKNGADFFEQDYFTPYMDTSRHWPLFLINTTIVNFGVRALFSPVRLDSISVARDLYGEFKNDKYNAGANIPMVACVNQSQAFPILSAYNYLDSIGRLCDGGLAENSGCATTFEVYQKLRQYCDTSSMRHVKFICINITNGTLDRNFKVPYKNASILNTVAAVANSPFDGSETYAYRNLERQIQFMKNYSKGNRLDSTRNMDTVVNFSLDTSVTLSRTLSKNSIDLMYSRMVTKKFPLP